jgi:hypothetical protein
MAQLSDPHFYYGGWGRFDILAGYRAAKCENFNRVGIADTVEFLLVTRCSKWWHSWPFFFKINLYTTGIRFPGISEYFSIHYNIRPNRQWAPSSWRIPGAISIGIKQPGTKLVTLHRLVESLMWMYTWDFSVCLHGVVLV